MKKIIWASVVSLALWQVALAEVSYVHSDHLGSTSVATNEDGNVQQASIYSPYGEVLKDLKAGGIQATAYLYTGQELDRESNLSYYGARFYDPTLARFISVDPVFDSPSPYAYVQDNPIRFTDPKGRETDIPDYSKYSNGLLLDKLEAATRQFTNLAGSPEALSSGVLDTYADQIDAILGELHTRHGNLSDADGLEKLFRRVGIEKVRELRGFPHQRGLSGRDMLEIVRTNRRQRAVVEALLESGDKKGLERMVEALGRLGSQGVVLGTHRPGGFTKAARLLSKGMKGTVVGAVVTFIAFGLTRDASAFDPAGATDVNELSVRDYCETGGPGACAIEAAGGPTTLDEFNRSASEIDPWTFEIEQARRRLDLDE